MPGPSTDAPDERVVEAGAPSLSIRTCVLDAWQLHEPELRGWMIGRLGNRDDADDLLQELFLKAIRQGDRFCSVTNARAWLFTVARNALADRLRLQRTLVALPDDLRAPTDSPAAVDALSACLPRALAEMSADDREVIERCDLGCMTLEAFAQLKGLSVPGAKSRVQRARKRLRAHLTSACQVRLDQAGRVCCFVPRPPADDPA